MTIAEPNYEDRYGTTFLSHAVPDSKLPAHGIPPVDAMRLLGEVDLEVLGLQRSPPNPRLWHVRELPGSPMR